MIPHADESETTSSSADETSGAETTVASTFPSEPETTATEIILEDKRRKTGIDGLYYLTEESGEYDTPEFYTDGKYLFYLFDQQFKLMDLTNGNTVLTQEAPALYCPFGLYDNGYYIVDKDKMTAYDFCGNKTCELVFPASDIWKLYVSPDLKQILYTEYKGSFIYDTDEKTLKEAGDDLFIGDVTGYKDGHFIAPDLYGKLCYIYDDGSIETISKRKSSRTVGDYTTETNDDGHTITPIGSDEVTLYHGDYETTNEYIVAADDRFFISQIFNDSIRIVDMQNSVATSILTTDYCLEIKSAGSNVFILKTMKNETHFEFYILYAEEAKYPVKINKKTGYVFPEYYEEFFVYPEVDGETKELLDTIYEAYNVRVFFELNEKHNGELYGYYFIPYTGDKKATLKNLMKFLKLSPENIWREINDGEECWIMICDKINEEPGAPVDVWGLTMDLGSNATIAVEGSTSSTMLSCLSHEFIHMLDKGVKYSYFNEWEELSPEDTYFWSYEKYGTRSDAYKYTCLGNDKKDKVYFIDNYARTFPTEDRARIGEYLYDSYYYGYLVWQFKDYKHVYEKAVKLCEILRDNYPCLETIPKGEWYLEKHLIFDS